MDEHNVLDQDRLVGMNAIAEWIFGDPVETEKVLSLISSKLIPVVLVRGTYCSLKSVLHDHYQQRLSLMEIQHWKQAGGLGGWNEGEALKKSVEHR